MSVRNERIARPSLFRPYSGKAEHKKVFLREHPVRAPLDL